MGGDMLLGCIADDLTGAADLSLTLVREGMRTVQVVGVPDRAGAPLPAADAVVVALKSRTIPAAEAVAQSCAAARALRAGGAGQLLFKYCSTFDSTDAGNIGPVAEALLALVGEDLTIACPAFPANGRTVYQGHLFVGTSLLSDSPMRDHPLTPMRDPDLVAVLQRQTRLPVGLVPFATVDAGAEAVRAAFAQAKAAGRRVVVVDALTDGHLRTIGAAAAGLGLITGGSGIALGLPEAFRAAGRLGRVDATAELAPLPGAAAILSGSCSQATRGQVEHAIASGMPARKLDAAALVRDPDGEIATALAWASGRLGAGPVLIYSGADPAEVASVQERFGQARAGEGVETAMARLATALVGQGVTRLVVAGGETSGAVVGALGARVLAIGPEIAPGVPWTRAESGMVLALKSGNFGSPDFFSRALAMLP